MWHCGPVDIETEIGRKCCQLEHYVGAVRDNPGTTFILGHSGALQWEDGLAIAQQYPNAWLEFSSQSLPVLRELIAKGPKDRMLFGSDWPFYHQATALAKVLIATDGEDEIRAGILSENAVRLYNLQMP
jgi:predicted TIM-barrel fold metal-dependent hydrolase